MVYKLLKIKRNIKFIVRDNNAKVPDSYIIREVWGDKHYIDENIVIGEESTVIDIGAHIGVFTVFAAKYAKRGKIFAYEPNLENYNLLRRNVILNNLTNVKTYRLGLGGRKQKARLYIDKENCAGHSLYEKADAYELINCITLKNIFDESGIKICHFLKIDCEGAEYDILLATPCRYFNNIHAIVLEYHRLLDYRDKLWKLERFLKKLGFKVKKRKIKIGRAEGILYAYK